MKNSNGESEWLNTLQARQDKCRGCRGLDSCRQTPKGFIPTAEESLGRKYESYAICKYERQRRAQEKINTRFHNSGIPAIYRDKKRDDYSVCDRNLDAVSTAKRIAESQEGAYFYGVQGTGKTLLVSLVALRKTNSGEQVLFISVPELMAELRRAMAVHEEVQKLELAKVADCLILDDLGAEKMTEWVGSQLFSILDYRLNHNLQTIITSNYSPQDVARRLAVNDTDDMQGRRLLSRIHGLCSVVRIDGRDGRISERVQFG